MKSLLDNPGFVNILIPHLAVSTKRALIESKDIQPEVKNKLQTSIAIYDGTYANNSEDSSNVKSLWLDFYTLNNTEFIEIETKINNKTFLNVTDLKIDATSSNGNQTLDQKRSDLLTKLFTDMAKRETNPFPSVNVIQLRHPNSSSLITHILSSTTSTQLKYLDLRSGIMHGKAAHETLLNLLKQKCNQLIDVRFEVTLIDDNKNDDIKNINDDMTTSALYALLSDPKYACVWKFVSKIRIGTPLKTSLSSTAIITLDAAIKYLFGPLLITPRLRDVDVAAYVNSDVKSQIVNVLNLYIDPKV